MSSAWIKLQKPELCCDLPLTHTLLYNVANVSQTLIKREFFKVYDIITITRYSLDMVKEFYGAVL
jgi:hypothetical protein